MLNIIKNNKEAFVLLGIIVISGVILAFNTDELRILMKGMYIITTQWGK